ncbi:hypothetical protein ACWIWK_07760 [Helicobacter sp. 23-1048]
MQVVKGLAYFEDGDLYRLSKDDKNILLNAVKNIDIAQIENTIQSNIKPTKTPTITKKPKPKTLSTR